MIQTVIRSLSITLGISVLCSSALLLFDVTFWKSFLLITAIQFGLWNLMSYALEWRSRIKMREIETEMLAEMSKQGIHIPCAYCKVENFVPIRFDEDNDFNCIECGKTSGVYIDIESATKTAPVDHPGVKINGDV